MVYPQKLLFTVRMKPTQAEVSMNCKFVVTAKNSPHQKHYYTVRSRTANVTLQESRCNSFCPYLFHEQLVSSCFIVNKVAPHERAVIPTLPTTVFNLLTANFCFEGQTAMQTADKGYFSKNHSLGIAWEILLIFFVVKSKTTCYEVKSQCYKSINVSKVPQFD